MGCATASKKDLQQQFYLRAIFFTLIPQIESAVHAFFGCGIHFDFMVKIYLWGGK